MDINLFKEPYHELFKILEESTKLINAHFKRGAPEGPPVLHSVYELQMSLRKSTKEDPSSELIKKVLNEVLTFFDKEKESSQLISLKNHIKKYLTH